MILTIAKRFPVSAVQIPDHLTCEDTLLENRQIFNLAPEMRMFLNCARTWCAQAGIVDKSHMNDMSQQSKHVDSMVKLLNRLLGMNLQQQDIIFGCGVQCSAQQPTSL